STLMAENEVKESAVAFDLHDGFLVSARRMINVDAAFESLVAPVSAARRQAYITQLRHNQEMKLQRHKMATAKATLESDYLHKKRQQLEEKEKEKQAEEKNERKLQQQQQLIATITNKAGSLGLPSVTGSPRRVSSHSKS